MTPAREHWQGPAGDVGRHLLELNERCLAAYRVNHALIEEHANAERIQTEGGYGRRQIWELIQNGADELIDGSGRVEVVLTESHLYCANEGRPITPQGVGAILSAYRSAKRGSEIGRFGLGFKSVLGVSLHPEFFSRSGSFGFDPETAAEQIRGLVPSAGDTPTLRLATPLDPAGAAKNDAQLAELMSWATTVVRLPLDRETGEWLPRDLRDFPKEFLVFSQHISLLVLDDRLRRTRREIALEGGDEGSVFRLVEGGEVDPWRVFTEEFKPSEAAARDGGAMAKRDIIRFQWAVPVRAQQRTGRLWAYFPTLEEITLSGVLNAPWKLNDDRTRVLEGPFNGEIIANCAKLVMWNLEVLVSDEDPGNVLDILPARGREARNWADRDLTELINSGAPSYASIPNQIGELDLPLKLSLHPEGLPRDAVEAWARIPGRPVDWVHPSVDANQTRRSRAERFIEAAGHRPSSLRDWLEAPVSGPDLVESAGALLVAALLVRASPAHLAEARAARIVVAEDGALVTCGDIFLPGEQAISIDTIQLVHPELAAKEKVVAALHVLGVRAVDPRLELEAFLGGLAEPLADSDWDSLLRLAGEAAPDDAADVLRAHGLGPDKLRVRVCSGDLVRLVGTILPGDIATADTAPECVIDVSHHRAELNLLRLLGAASAPQPGGGRLEEPILRSYRRAAVERFLASLGAARPDQALIRIDERSFAGPVTPIMRMPERARARFTLALLRAQPEFARWEVSHTSSHYQPITVEHPLIEIVREYGVAEVGDRFDPVDQWVGPGLAEWERLLPVVRVPGPAAEALGLRNSFEELDDKQWTRAFERVVELGEVRLASRFYSAACACGAPVPARVLCEVGKETSDQPPGEVRVAASAREVEVLAASRLPCLLADDQAMASLVEQWGMRLASDEIASEVVAIESAPRVPLLDMFPALRLKLPGAERDLQLARCEELHIETFAASGRISETTLLHIADGVVYADGALGHAELLRRLGERLGLTLDARQIDKIIENKLDQEVSRLRKNIRSKATDAERLAEVVDEAALSASLPQALLSAVETIRRHPDHVELAEIAFAALGVETVQTFKAQFEERGLQPPSRWAGSRSAVEWVRKLGFAREQAGFEDSRRPPRLEIDGPPDLKTLHDYQRTIVDEIHRLLRGEDGLRGIVSLPTGAGKTHVAIQALVEAMTGEDPLHSPILWVAQRDELCEQAVQAWSEVWRARGRSSGRLTISRLWASNEAEPVDDGDQVVVATIDKLSAGVFDDTEYKWLSNASCLVIDEAHAAITPQYTRLLEWQGMARGKDRAPLIGLTATPFRGTSEEETQRLISRFGGTRLDKALFGDDDPYRVLQEMGVLSKVQHEVLEGSELHLSASEIETVSRTRLLPSSVSDRLAVDADRNRVLLDSICALPEDWTVLLFGTSVEHAVIMAGLLSTRDIPAAAISASTSPAARRHYVEAFRRQKIRVLSNYAVFSAGFDAPLVRAVYVARPTYSPNLYQQMIGRGLRGPLNGGSEECRIVNVADNILNFGEALAFREFEHLWEPRRT